MQVVGMIHPKLSFHGISIHRFVPSFFILKLYELSIFIFGILALKKMLLFIVNPPRVARLGGNMV